MCQVPYWEFSRMFSFFLQLFHVGNSLIFLLRMRHKGFVTCHCHMTFQQLKRLEFTLRSDSNIYVWNILPLPLHLQIQVPAHMPPKYSDLQNKKINWERSLWGRLDSGKFFPSSPWNKQQCFLPHLTFRLKAVRSCVWVFLSQFALSCLWADLAIPAILE